MKNDKIKNQYRVNEQIRAKEVRVVNDGGSTVVSTRQALDMARSQGVDLVEISPNAEPPVCRLIDYSKFLYQQKNYEEQKLYKFLIAFFLILSERILIMKMYYNKSLNAQMNVNLDMISYQRSFE